MSTADAAMIPAILSLVVSLMKMDISSELLMVGGVKSMASVMECLCWSGTSFSNSRCASTVGTSVRGMTRSQLPSLTRVKRHITFNIAIMWCCQVIEASPTMAVVAVSE
jgi:hypothetical protein